MLEREAARGATPAPALGPVEDDENECGVAVTSGPVSPTLPVKLVPLNYRRRRRRNSRGWHDD
jgi:hypothetical protein